MNFWKKKDHMGSNLGQFIQLYLGLTRREYSYFIPPLLSAIWITKFIYYKYLYSVFIQKMELLEF
jgi:hypothetical protein